jgi:hypothetical protein
VVQQDQLRLVILVVQSLLVTQLHLEVQLHLEPLEVQ